MPRRLCECGQELDTRGKCPICHGALARPADRARHVNARIRNAERANVVAFPSAGEVRTAMERIAGPMQRMNFGRIAYRKPRSRK